MKEVGYIARQKNDELIDRQYKFVMRPLSHPLLGYAQFHLISKGLPRRSRNRKSLISGDLSTAYKYLPTAFWSPIAEVISVSYCRQGGQHVYLTYCSSTLGITIATGFTSSRMSPSRMPPGRRSCLPYRISKRRCSREVPFCQSCVVRGKSEACVYEDMSPPDRDNWQPRRSERRDQCISALDCHQIQSQESRNNGTTVLQGYSQPPI